MITVARAYRPRELAAEAFSLYERFRPVAPEGVRGWGAKGVLSPRLIWSLAKGLESALGAGGPQFATFFSDP